MSYTISKNVRAYYQLLIDDLSPCHFSQTARSRSVGKTETQTQMRMQRDRQILAGYQIARKLQLIIKV